MGKVITPEQTVLEKLASVHYQAIPTLRSEKDRRGYTNEYVAAQVGLKKDNVDKFFRGELANPNVFNISAICEFLNLSMDAIFRGTKKTDENDSLKNEYIIRELNSEIEHQKKINAMQQEELSRYSGTRKEIFVLVGIIFVLSIAVTGYLFLDLFNRNIGLVRHEASSLFYVVVIGVITGVAVVMQILAKLLKRKR